jgi:CheY-like chemotaxis protein/HPt (histidine-containing phosphotransfer) domain-containing protein
MQPISVGTTDAALTALRSAAATGEPFEIVLLDMLLPDGDGLALARAITAGYPTTPPHLLLLTSGHDDDPSAARAAGISQILTKPVRQSELVDALVGAVSSALRPHDEDEGTAAILSEGRRILVVEDNQINQMVAVGLLEAAGYVADVVGDGVEAVTALADGHPYAAVLMDCRMPRLDGFDATRAIRAAEHGMSRVPIIAMTASALEGEHERCVAAGMDDFLTKPVDPVRLLRVVRRWADTDLRPADDSDDGAPPPAEDLAPVTDPERMAMLDEMKRDGLSLFERASANFVAHAEEHLREIRSAVEADDASSLVASAHKLKGSATNLGLPALGEAAEALELAGHDDTLGDCDVLLTVLQAQMEQALQALDRIRTAGLP